MSDLSRLRWRCRRGMRELDALMLAWLDTHHQQADEPTREKFAELLAMQDPDIMALLKKFDGPFDGSGVHPVTSSTSSKDSSFETIIRQARKAAAVVAAQNTTQQVNSNAGQTKKQSGTSHCSSD